MLCGYLKQTCKSITVSKLIELLKLCKNPDAIIKMNDMTNFYMHFDIDGQFINFNKSPSINQYGECGSNNTCASCIKNDNDKKCCNCDGKDCINASSIVDTEKYDEWSSSETIVQEDTKNQPSTNGIQNDKYNLDNFAINGANDSLNYNPHVEQKTLEFKCNEKEKDGIILTDKVIEQYIDSAITKSLEKIIKSLKG